MCQNCENVLIVASRLAIKISSDILELSELVGLVA